MKKFMSVLLLFVCAFCVLGVQRNSDVIHGQTVGNDVDIVSNCRDEYYLHNQKYDRLASKDNYVIAKNKQEYINSFADEKDEKYDDKFFETNDLLILNFHTLYNEEVLNIEAKRMELDYSGGRITSNIYVNVVLYSSVYYDLKNNSIDPNKAGNLYVFQLPIQKCDVDFTTLNNSVYISVINTTENFVSRYRSAFYKTNTRNIEYVAIPEDRKLMLDEPSKSFDDFKVKYNTKEDLASVVTLNFDNDTFIDTSYNYESNKSVCQISKGLIVRENGQKQYIVVGSISERNVFDYKFTKEDLTIKYVDSYCYGQYVYDVLLGDNEIMRICINDFYLVGCNDYYANFIKEHLEVMQPKNVLYPETRYSWIDGTKHYDNLKECYVPHCVDEDAFAHGEKYAICPICGGIVEKGFSMINK